LIFSRSQSAFYGYFCDFAKMVHPNAENLGASTIWLVVAQLGLFERQAVDIDQLKAFIATGRRLDEFGRIADARAIFACPRRPTMGIGELHMRSLEKTTPTVDDQDQSN